MKKLKLDIQKFADNEVYGYYDSHSKVEVLPKSNIIKISLENVQLNPTGLGSILVNYPEGCNRSNMNLISFKIKKHGGATADYIMFGTRTYVNGTYIPEPTLTITYQDNAMYVSGTPFWYASDQQDIDLIFLKI